MVNYEKATTSFEIVLGLILFLPILSDTMYFVISVFLVHNF